MMWAIGGLVLAVALSFTAFAVASGPISEPAGSVHVINASESPGPDPSPSHSQRPGHSPTPTKTSEPPTSTASPTSNSAQPTPTDDHGGSSHDSHSGDD